MPNGAGGWSGSGNQSWGAPTAYVPGSGGSNNPGPIDSFTKWWATHQASLTSATKDKYASYLQQTRARAAGLPSMVDPTWGDTWSNYSDRYNNQQTGMDALLGRIASGPQASDYADAQNQIASLYGYSPASYSALVAGMGDRLNATNVMTNAGNIAVGMQNSEFGQQQTQAMRIAEKQASDDVGKQLESIFGARGGLAGFQAAYDMTSQLQSSFAQQASKNSLDMFDRAVSAVNSENDYYKQLIDNGAIQSEDYVKFRFSQLQQGYQDYATSMAQTMSQAQGDYQNNVDTYNRIGDEITKALNSEMGVDKYIQDAMKNQYDYYSQMAQDTEAANLDSKGGQKHAWDTFWATYDWGSGGTA
jgi:hypothetical protein